MSRKGQFQATIDYRVKKGAVSGDRQSQICFSQDFNSMQKYLWERLYLTPWRSPEGLRNGLNVVTPLMFDGQARGAPRCSCNSYKCSNRFFLELKTRLQTNLTSPVTSNCSFLDMIIYIPLACQVLRLYPRLSPSLLAFCVYTAKNSNMTTVGKTLKFQSSACHALSLVCAFTSISSLRAPDRIH